MSKISAERPLSLLKKTPGFCALCKSRCGCLMVTQGDQFLAQEPNAKHPTGKALCVKGKAAPEIIYDPQRQLYPLKRTRPKGESDPGWQQISWEEALGTVTSQLARLRLETGPESVAFGLTTPSGTPISDNIKWIERFINVFGSPNVASGTEICNWHKDNAHAYTFGRGIASPDFENSRCVVLWGHNPSATWLDHATAVSAAKARGARLVVVDPRRAGFSSRADQWLRVRPGADGVLALGIAGQMIENNWFDVDFVRQWTNGPFLIRSDTSRFLRVSDLKEPPANSRGEDYLAWSNVTGSLIAYSSAEMSYRDTQGVELDAKAELVGTDGMRISCHTAFHLYKKLCQEYPPETVERLAWVPAEQVTATAKMLFESSPVSYYAWSGVGQHTNATQTDRAISILFALTGSFDKRGGNVEYEKPDALDVSGREFMSLEQSAKCIGLTKSPLGPAQDNSINSSALYAAILDASPYQIRGLFNFGRNFLMNHADAERGARALQELEFYVHADLFLTPTAKYADIFLPINTPWEREALRVGFDGSQAAENLIQLRQAAIKSLGESRSDAEVVFDLAMRLGFGDRFWNGNIGNGLNAILQPLGLNIETLRSSPNGISMSGKPRYFAYQREGFKTQTGKIEIYSERFKESGQDPLPSFIEPAVSPYRTGQSGFPLVLTSAKVVQFLHSQHRNIASLRRRYPQPEITMHPDVANDRGFSEGDWVEIKTKNGSIRMKARLDDSLNPRVVCAQYGWWQSSEALRLPPYDPFSANGANLNRLISDADSDPISGSSGLRSSLCEIIPLNQERRDGWTGWRKFLISALEREARDIYSFTLRPIDNGQLPLSKGGQHITIRLFQDDGNWIVRCYSISRSVEANCYRISVKRTCSEVGITGGMSSLLHNLVDLAPTVVEVRAPRGEFHLDDNVNAASSLVLVAAGIGITPLLSMLYQFRDERRRGQVHLFYGVRSREDHAFDRELQALSVTIPRLMITTCYSSPNADDMKGIHYNKQGRITAADILSAANPSSSFYLCGPQSMIAEVSAGLELGGVAKDKIHCEAFGPSSRAAVIGEYLPQKITLTNSNRTLIWDPAEGSILDVLESAGVAISSGCRTGQCESCLVSLESGSVQYPDGVALVDKRHCLPCVAIPLGPISVGL